MVATFPPLFCVDLEMNNGFIPAAAELMIFSRLLIMHGLVQCFSNYLMWRTIVCRTGKFFFQCARDWQAKQAGPLLLFLFSGKYPHTGRQWYVTSHSRKPDLPVTHFSPFSTWLSVLLFFFSPLLKPRCQGRVTCFVGGGGNIAIATAKPPSFCVYCVVNI